MDDINFNNSLTANRQNPNPSIKDISEGNREVKSVVKRGKSEFAKPSLLTKVKNTLFPEDWNEVKAHVFEDVFVPLVRDGILNTAISALTMIFGGNPRYYGGYRSYNNISKASWRQPDKYDNTPYDRYGYRRDERNTYMSTQSYRDVKLSDYQDMLDVIAELYSTLENYQMVRVSDYLSAANLTGEFTDNQWGWYDLPPRITPRRTMDGCWTIDLPRPVPLNR